MIISFIIPFKGSNTDVERIIFNHSEILGTRHEVILVYDNKSKISKVDITNFQIVKSTRDGIYPAMNAGIHAASGDYLFFLGQTDELCWSNIHKLPQLNCDVAICDFKIGSRIRKNSPGKSYIYHHQSLIIRKKHLINYDILYDTTFQIHAAYDFIIKLCSTAKTKKHIEGHICTFKKGGTSTSRQNILLSLKKIFRIQIKNDVFHLLTFISIAVRRLSYLVR